MKHLACTYCIVCFTFSNLYAQNFSGHTDYKKADSIAAHYPGHSLKDLPKLTLKLTSGLSTDQEKFRTLYKWLCSNIEYDVALKEKSTKRARIKNITERAKWDDQYRKRVFKNLLHDHKTVCSGYAYLLKELSSHAGLQCEIINGYGRTRNANIRGSGIINHAWNAIRLDGKWYLCDATWSSGFCDPETMAFTKEYDNVYFLSDPRLFIKDHYPSDSSWMFLAQKPTLQSFLNAPLIYSQAYRVNISNLNHDSFDIAATKGEPVTFFFTANKSIITEKAELLVIGPASTSINRQRLIPDAEGNFCLDHIFTAKGNYLVHVLMNNSYTVTFSVKVTKGV